MKIKEFEQKLNTEKGRLELAKGWANYMMEEYCVADITQEWDYSDLLRKYLPKSFQMYNDRGNINVVMNVKQKGSPNWESVEKELGIEIDDNSCDSIWNGEVSMFADILDNDIFPADDIAIVGRMGGYWGFRLGDDNYYSLLEWDEKKIVPLLNTVLINDKEKIMETMRQDEYFPIEDRPENDFYYVLEYDFNIPTDTLLTCVKLSDEWTKKLKEFEETMNLQIKEFESTDYWVTLLRDNPSLLAK